MWAGVIGRRIKLQALLDSVPKLVSKLGPGPEDAHHAAVGITTTDLVSKSAAIEVLPVMHCCTLAMPDRNLWHHDVVAF